MKYILSFFLIAMTATQIRAEPYPIQFSIPECKIVKKIPAKTIDFATLIPGRLETYIYLHEPDYYRGYQKAYYAITKKKDGWDCMRHYEILANGCIPYFLDLDACDEKTMPFLPRELIKEAMNLKGVSYLHIDHTQFEKEKYFEILQKLLDHTRQYLTTRQMAAYILKKMGYSGKGKILFLSGQPETDYLRCLTLIGLKEIAKGKVTDVIPVKHIYKNYIGDISTIYGKGMSYTRIVEDYPVNRKNIERRIQNREFELIIYGSVHRGRPYHDLVLKNYPSSKICYLCGEDAHRCEYSQYPNLFLRESDSYVP